MKNITLKNFDQFLIEADLRGSKGVPSDFLSSAEEEARKNLGVSIDRGQASNRLSGLISNSLAIINKGSDIEIAERKKSLEDLAKKVIIEEFGFILDASEKPVELDIRIVGDVMKNMPALGNKAEISMNIPDDSNEVDNQEEGETEEQEDSEPQSQEEDDFFSFFDDENEETEEEHEEENVETLSNKDVALAIDKKKILNLFTQGAGKATKDIIKYSETVEKGLERIFGEENYKSVIKTWSDLSDEADKADWEIPVGMKQALFRNLPGGIAGAVDVNWESLNNTYHNIEMLKEDADFEKIMIRAYAIDFPMLIHEATKGVYILLQSAAIKKDPELAREIKRATSSYRDEAEEFRYGPLANQMFASFVNNCLGAETFPNAKERIFGALALDKERGGRFTDKQFLEITNEIFSSFDKTEDESGKIRFILNREKFEETRAKSHIEKLLSEFNEMWSEYEEELRKWEIEQKFGGEPEDLYQDEEPESDIDKLVKQTLSREQEDEDKPRKEYKDMSVSEIQDEIQKAVADEDYELAGYLKNTFLKGEAKKVWDIELKRIFESKIKR